MLKLKIFNMQLSYLTIKVDKINNFYFLIYIYIYIYIYLNIKLSINNKILYKKQFPIKIYQIFQD